MMARSIMSAKTLLRAASVRHFSETEIGSLFRTLDTNRDNVLHRHEVVNGAEQLQMTPSEAHTLFDYLDKNKDGVISRAEFSVLEDNSVFSGIQHFLTMNLQDVHHTKPLGRWTVEADNFEKSYAYDHSA